MTSRRLPDGSVATAPRGFFTSPGKRGKSARSFFSMPEYVPEPFQDPIRPFHYNKMRVAKMMESHDAPFRSISPVPEKLIPYPYMETIPNANKKSSQLKPRRDKDGSVITEPRNFLASPPKKGNPNNTPGTAFSTFEYLPDPIHLQKEKLLNQIKTSREKIEVPFRSASPCGNTFQKDSELFELIVNQPQPSQKSKTPVPTMSSEAPFKYTNPPGKSVVDMTISPYPEYISEPLPVVTRKKPDERTPWKAPRKQISANTPSVARNVINLRSEFPELKKRIY
jgi:hypothetical protein